MEEPKTKQYATKRQIQYMEFIQKYIELNKKSPSIIDIKRHFNLASTRGVIKQLNSLEKKGFLTIGTEARSIKPKRQYPNDVPNPETQVEEFNEYLRKNNEVVEETAYWIVIKNSYIENQLVMFSTVRGVATIQDFHPKSQPAIEMLAMLSKYSGKHIYINADSEKSIPNRLHIHIKL